MLPMNISGAVCWWCDLFVRAFIVTVAASIFRLFLRKESPAIRHLYGVCVVVLLLVLPLILLVPPFWQAAASPVFPFDDLSGENSLPTASLSEAFQKPLVNNLPPVAAPPGAATTHTPPSVDQGKVRCIAAGLAISASLMVAVRLIIVWSRMRRLVGQCPVLENDDPLYAERDRLQRCFKIHTPITLRVARQSDALPVALTMGWRRPVIVLPESVRVWGNDRIRVVLCHEIAHIQRRDWLFLMLAEVARALYAINPLVWKLAEDLRNDAEMATDDRVIASGIGASEYATHLVDIAAGLRSAGALGMVSVPMAAKRRLTARVQRLLSEKIAHRSLRGVDCCFPILLFVALLTSATLVNRRPVFAQERNTILELRATDRFMVHRQNPEHLIYFASLEQALKRARAENKPIFIDFTGYTVSNARFMEETVFPHPAVRAELSKFVRVRLYTDGGLSAEKNRNYQNKTFHTVALPLYAVLTPDGKLVASTGYTLDAAKFASFLAQAGQRSDQQFKSRTRRLQSNDDLARSDANRRLGVIIEDLQQRKYQVEKEQRTLEATKAVLKKRIASMPPHNPDFVVTSSKQERLVDEYSRLQTDLDTLMVTLDNNRIEKQDLLKRLEHLQIQRKRFQKEAANNREK